MPFVLLTAKRRDGTFKLGRIGAAHVERIAECYCLLHAGSFAQLFGQIREIGRASCRERVLPTV